MKKPIYLKTMSSTGQAELDAKFLDFSLKHNIVEVQPKIHCDDEGAFYVLFIFYEPE